jgi:hypothetical protein
MGEQPAAGSSASGRRIERAKRGQRLDKVLSPGENPARGLAAGEHPARSIVCQAGVGARAKNPARRRAA